MDEDTFAEDDGVGVATGVDTDVVPVDVVDAAVVDADVVDAAVVDAAVVDGAAGETHEVNVSETVTVMFSAVSLKFVHWLSVYVVGTVGFATATVHAASVYSGAETIPVGHESLT